MLGELPPPRRPKTEHHYGRHHNRPRHSSRRYRNKRESMCTMWVGNSRLVPKIRGDAVARANIFHTSSRGEMADALAIQ